MIDRRGATLAIVFAILFAADANMARCQPSIPSYYDILPYNLTSPSAYPTAIGAFQNPAVYGTLPSGDLQFTWIASDNRYKQIEEWGVFLGTPRIGFGVIRNRFPADSAGQFEKVEDWRIGLTDTYRMTTLAIGFGWSTGDAKAENRSEIIQAAIAQRFGRWAIAGAVGNFALDNANQYGFFDAAVRPFANRRVIAFGDFELPKGVSAKNAAWSAGTRLEILTGIPITGRYFNDNNVERLATSVSVGFGGVWRIGIQALFNTTDDSEELTAELRWGYEERSILEKFFD